MTILWSSTAIGDLVQIRRTIADNNPPAARKIAEAILASVENLPDFPDMGRPGRLPDTRELAVPGTLFVIPYRVTARGVEIIAVLHGARQWPREEPSG